MIVILSYGLLYTELRSPLPSQSRFIYSFFEDEDHFVTDSKLCETGLMLEPLINLHVDTNTPENSRMALRHARRLEGEAAFQHTSLQFILAQSNKGLTNTGKRV